MTFYRYCAGLSLGGLWSRIEAHLTHQYRLIRTFPGITGKVTSLVSHYRRVQTAEKRNFFLSSLRFPLLFLLSRPPPRPLTTRLLLLSSRLSSLHGEARPLAENVVSSRFLLVFTPSSACVNRPIPARLFLHPHSRSVCFPYPSPLHLLQHYHYQHYHYQHHLLLLLFYRTGRVSGTGTTSRVTIGK